MANIKQSTLSFIINNAPQDLLSAEDELELGRKIQLALKYDQWDRLQSLKKQENLSTDEKDELGELELKFDGVTVPEIGADEREKVRAEGKAAKESLVLHNTKLVVFVAKQYAAYKIELAELVQEGMIGCMTAADKYDPDRGYRFSTCAVPWIRQQIYRYVQQVRKTIRLPAHVIEGISRINRIIEQYENEHEGMRPTDEEIAELSEGKLTLENVRLYQKAAMPLTSLNMIVGDEEDTELEELVGDDRELSPSEYTKQHELHDLLMKYIDELPEIQQQIILMRYGFEGQELTLEEVGKLLGYTRERIRQMEAEALVTIQVRARRNGDLEQFYN